MSRGIHSAGCAAQRRGEGADSQRPKLCSAGGRIGKRRLPVRDQCLRLYRIHIDGAVEVTSTVEVIFQAQREIVSQITFPAEIGLMGIVVLEVFGIRKSKRLNAKGNARAQVLLAHKDGRGIGGGIEALLVLQVIETARQTQAGESLKSIGSVKGAGERTISAGYDAGRAGTDDRWGSLRAG